MSPGDRRPTPGRRRQGGSRPAQGQGQGQGQGQKQGERQPERGTRAPWRGGGRTVEEVSAGGIVVETSTGEARAALIARLNRAGRLEWCLPKGHLEGTETPQEAAVREVAEETGITGVVVGELGTIDYWFSAEGRRIHKTVHHYLLEATGGAISVDGDPDAEAVEAAWVPVAQLGQRLAFSNERRIARAASELLASGG